MICKGIQGTSPYKRENNFCFETICHMNVLQVWGFIYGIVLNGAARIQPSWPVTGSTNVTGTQNWFYRHVSVIFFTESGWELSWVLVSLTHLQTIHKRKRMQSWFTLSNKLNWHKGQSVKDEPRYLENVLSILPLCFTNTVSGGPKSPSLVKGSPRFVLNNC